MTNKQYNLVYYRMRDMLLPYSVTDRINPFMEAARSQDLMGRDITPKLNVSMPDRTEFIDAIVAAETYRHGAHVLNKEHLWPAFEDEIKKAVAIVEKYGF